MSRYAQSDQLRQSAVRLCEEVRARESRESRHYAIMSLLYNVTKSQKVYFSLKLYFSAFCDFILPNLIQSFFLDKCRDYSESKVSPLRLAPPSPQLVLARPSPPTRVRILFSGSVALLLGWRVTSFQLFLVLENRLYDFVSHSFHDLVAVFDGVVESSAYSRSHDLVCVQKHACAIATFSFHEVQKN